MPKLRKDKNSQQKLHQNVYCLGYVPKSNFTKPSTIIFWLICFLMFQGCHSKTCTWINCDIGTYPITIKRDKHKN